MFINRPHHLGRIAAVGALAGLAFAGVVQATITLYEHDGFRGRSLTLGQGAANLRVYEFNDLASSVIVERGRWLACEHEGFRGRCVVFDVGSHASLRSLGLNDTISSIRPYRRGMDERWEVAGVLPPAEVYPWYQRPGERIYEAPVIYVRAVMGPPEQRCWTEHRPGSGGDPNVGGAVVGAIIGGIIGHQIGSGRGNDAATVAGAVAGAALGAQTGGGGLPYSRDIRRCETVGGGNVAYYDVGYTFRGQDHYVQMSHPPGRTIRVNARGEPRQ